MWMRGLLSVGRGYSLTRDNTFRSGNIVAEHIFTSVPPRDGEAPIVQHDRHVIEIDERR